MATEEVSHDGVVSILRWGHGQCDELFHSITGELASLDGAYALSFVGGVGVLHPRDNCNGGPK